MPNVVYSDDNQEDEITSVKQFAPENAKERINTSDPKFQLWKLPTQPNTTT